MCPAQLLGLNARELYLDPQLIHAYEELSAAPVEDGFTTQAAQGRAVLLQEAVQVQSVVKVECCCIYLGRCTLEHSTVPLAAHPDPQFSTLPGQILCFWVCTDLPCSENLP